MKLFKNKKLLIIFAVALILRFYKISSIPLGPDGDEAAFGYYGFSLINNLSDEFGNKLPLYFPSIGDYKYPVYAYFTTLPVLVLGLGVFSTRFISALAGSLMVLVVYHLSFEVFNKKNVAYLAALLVAFSPYGIIFSRGAYEANLAMFLVSLGLLFLLKSLTVNKKKLFLYFSFLLFVLSIFTYSPVRLFLILLLPLIYFISLRFGYLSEKNKKRFIAYFFALIALIVLVSLDPRSRARAFNVGFQADPWTSTYLANSAREDAMVLGSESIVITRLFHNKFVAYGLNFLERYLEHFNPIYLFIKGNINLPKYSVPNMGLFYFFEMLTILLGLIYFLNQKSKLKWVIFGWLLIFAIPSALTTETPNPIRSLIGLPALVIISSLGTSVLLEKVKFKKLAYTGFVVVLFLHLIYFWHQYSVHDKLDRPDLYDAAMKELVMTVNDEEKNFQRIFMPDDPYIFFLYYGKITPREFLQDSEVEPERIGEWERVTRLGKIYFKMPQECPQEEASDILYICKGPKEPLFGKTLKTIYYPDNVAAYFLVEYE